MNEVKYFICVTDWVIIDKVTGLGIWGVSEKSRSQIQKTRIGDVLLFYLKMGKYHGEKKDASIFGIFEVSSDVWKEENNIFEENKNELGSKLKEKYPYRIKIKPIYTQKPRKFRPLVEELSFITNKKYWGSRFMGRSMIEINERDYKKIKEVLS